MAEASSAEPRDFTSLDHSYWKNKLPRGFQFYIDRLARAFLRVQPSNGAEFAAVIMVELLTKRNGMTVFFALKSCSGIFSLGTPTLHRPDMTTAVDWALKANYLSIYPTLHAHTHTCASRTERSCSLSKSFCGTNGVENAANKV